MSAPAQVGSRAALRRLIDLITHEGPFMGVPPTGRTFRTNEVLIARYEDGRAVELWSIVDALSVMQQLGAVPP